MRSQRQLLVLAAITLAALIVGMLIGNSAPHGAGWCAKGEAASFCFREWASAMASVIAATLTGASLIILALQLRDERERHRDELRRQSAPLLKQIDRAVDFFLARPKK
jgi:hypothetical protein